MAPAQHRRPAPPAPAPARPPLAALFLVDFDAKAGYTIVWRRAAAGLALDGRVEYKSLPSGLHAVRRDVVYFVHDARHAGLSAFVNRPCDDDAARNARMVAVGALVPLSYGRLGRAWRHADSLERLAASLAADADATDLLDQYWQANRARDASPSPPDAAPDAPPDAPPEPRTHGRVRSISDGAALLPAGHRLSPYHPAWSLTKLLDALGPLVFPIHRAALLRRRILISCHAPVHQICDFVYVLSVLSNVPLSVSDSLPASSVPARLRPLFAIGVHDIPFLVDDLEASRRQADGQAAAAAAADGPGSGWIACTTDSILAMKDTLWDMLITMPPDGDAGWPVVECPRGTPVKATQRDLRRYHSLRSGLARLAPAAPGEPPSDPSVAAEPLDQLVEPPSWAVLAYNGYMWWASAGEQLRADEHEEAARDAALLADLGPAPASPASSRRPSADPLVDSVASLAPRRPSDPGQAHVELALIAYFHRLTAQMLSVLADLVDAADAAYPESYDDGDDGDDDGEDDALLRPDAADDPPITVDSHCVERMGLDVWSAADAAFVQDLVAAYFGRTARVEGKGVEVCGVRVC